MFCMQHSKNSDARYSRICDNGQGCLKITLHSCAVATSHFTVVPHLQLTHLATEATNSCVSVDVWFSSDIKIS